MVVCFQGPLLERRCGLWLCRLPTLSLLSQSSNFVVFSLPASRDRGSSTLRQIRFRLHHFSAFLVKYSVGSRAYRTTYVCGGVLAERWCEASITILLDVLRSQRFFGFFVFFFVCLNRSFVT